MGAEFKLWKHDEEGGDYNGETHTQEPTGIDFFTRGTDALRQMNIFHEFGHLLDNVPGTWNVFSSAVSKESNTSWILSDKKINPVALKSLTIKNDPNYDSVQARQTYYGFGPAEQWADAFGNYVAGNIDLSKPAGPGIDMYNFVTATLAPYMIERD
jgi:hypothetical protein